MRSIKLYQYIEMRAELIRKEAQKLKGDLK